MAIGPFSTGLSGLSAHSEALKVVGSNLANLNTVGFKSNTIAFQELVDSGPSASSAARGLGVTVASVAPVFSQGTIENSREATNAAIKGNGLFLVKGPLGLTYTRAGNFSFNANGELVTPDGYKVQGFTTIDPVTGRPDPTAQPTDIKVSPGLLRAPVATSLVSMTSNLDAGAAVGATFNGTLQIYDSLGAAHVMTVAYTNTAPGAWNFEVSVPGADVAPAGNVPVVVASGTLTFDANGKLASMTPAGPATGGGSAVPGPMTDIEFATPAWANGAAAGTLTWDIVDSSGAGLLTGFASPSASTSKTQDGSPAGGTELIAISDDGIVSATAGTGQAIAVAQLALATFNNPKGLVNLGANKFAASVESGLANVGEPGTGGRGSLVGSAVEQSNVDIAYEFTQMILAQRGYQANSKTITVADELLVDTLSMKR